MTRKWFKTLPWPVVEGPGWCGGIDPRGTFAMPDRFIAYGIDPDHWSGDTYTGPLALPSEKVDRVARALDPEAFTLAAADASVGNCARVIKAILCAKVAVRALGAR